VLEGMQIINMLSGESSVGLGKIISKEFMEEGINLLATKTVPPESCIDYNHGLV